MKNPQGFQGFFVLEIDKSPFDILLLNGIYSAVHHIRPPRNIEMLNFSYDQPPAMAQGKCFTLAYCCAVGRIPNKFALSVVFSNRPLSCLN